MSNIDRAGLAEQLRSLAGNSNNLEARRVLQDAIHVIEENVDDEGNALMDFTPFTPLSMETEQDALWYLWTNFCAMAEAHVMNANDCCHISMSISVVYDVLYGMSRLCSINQLLEHASKIVDSAKIEYGNDVSMYEQINAGYRLMKKTNLLTPNQPPAVDIMCCFIRLMLYAGR